MNVHFSTGKDNWATPWATFAPWHERFNFTVDGAADGSNHLLPRWWGPGGEHSDFLATTPEDWAGQSVWLNPPYSRRSQAAFVRHAVAMARQARATCVILIPARTDTKLFHEVLWDADSRTPNVSELHFLKGRIKFVGADDGAPFPSMVVVV